MSESVYHTNKINDILIKKMFIKGRTFAFQRFPSNVAPLINELKQRAIAGCLIVCVDKQQNL